MSLTGEVFNPFLFSATRAKQRKETILENGSRKAKTEDSLLVARDK